jgi:hypothetical protein
MPTSSRKINSQNQPHKYNSIVMKMDFEGSIVCDVKTKK